MEQLPRDLALNNQTKEGLNKLQNLFSRHSGVGQNLVKTIAYWMLVASDSMSSHDISYIL